MEGVRMKVNDNSLSTLSSVARRPLVSAGTFWCTMSSWGPGLPKGEAFPPPQSQSVSLLGELSASGSLYGLLLQEAG